MAQGRKAEPQSIKPQAPLTPEQQLAELLRADKTGQLRKLLSPPRRSTED